MKRICVVTRNMLSGGAERVIAQLLNNFAKCGIDCSIITMDDEAVFYDLYESIRLTPVGIKSENKLIDRIKRCIEVRSLVKEEKPDVVLTMPEDTGVYVILALLGMRIPVYVSERNNPWVMPNVKITRILRTLMYPFAKGIIFQTEMAKSFFPEYIQKKGIVLPNPVDDSRIPQPYCGEREKWIAAVGRLDAQKNFPMLIRAFHQFAHKHPDYRLVIFGEGRMRGQLETLVTELGEGERISLPGRSEHVLEEIKKAAMFVLSSDYEGMPNVLLEAMCMGMPVISTDCPSGGPRELIVHGENGLLVPVGDEVALCQAMEGLADEKYASRLAKAAFEIRPTVTSRDVFDMWKNYLFECNGSSK